MSDKIVQRLVASIFSELKENDLITFKEKEDVAFRRACDLIRKEFAKEEALNDEVQKMMDELERQNPGAFQRFKMFPLLKKRLAKEKGIIL